MAGLSTVAQKAPAAWGRRDGAHCLARDSIETTNLICYLDPGLCNYFLLLQECIADSFR
jgi:hypothetical protein